MAWTDLSAAFTYGSKLTAAQMSSLRDNVTALANGDSGAPEIITAALADAAVNQPKLKTATGSASGTLGAQTTVNIAGNAYSFSPTHEANLPGTPNQCYLMPYNAGSASADQVARWAYYNPDGVQSVSYYSGWRYVTATDNPSIYVIRDKKTGQVKHLWESDDPSDMRLWGTDEAPTDLVLPVVDGGVTFRRHEGILILNCPTDDFKLFRERVAAEPGAPFEVANNHFDIGAGSIKPRNLTAV